MLTSGLPSESASPAHLVALVWLRAGLTSSTCSSLSRSALKALQLLQPKMLLQLFGTPATSRHLGTSLAASKKHFNVYITTWFSDQRSEAGRASQQVCRLCCLWQQVFSNSTASLHLYLPAFLHTLIAHSLVLYDMGVVRAHGSDMCSLIAHLRYAFVRSKQHLNNYLYNVLLYLFVRQLLSVDTKQPYLALVLHLLLGCFHQRCTELAAAHNRLNVWVQPLCLRTSQGEALQGPGGCCPFYSRLWQRLHQKEHHQAVQQQVSSHHLVSP